MTLYDVVAFRFEKKRNFLGFEYIESEKKSNTFVYYKSNQAELIDRARHCPNRERLREKIAAELGYFIRSGQQVFVTLRRSRLRARSLFSMDVNRHEHLKGLSLSVVTRG